MKTIQRKLTGEAVCTVCSSPSYADLRADLDAGVRVAEVAERYAVSVGAVYRHRRSGHDAVRLVAVDDVDGLALADRLQLLFDRATMASEALHARGDLRGGSLAADSALRAANALHAQGLGGDKVRTEIAAAQTVYRNARALARTVDAFLERHPEHEEALAVAAESVGATGLAADFRADPNEPRAADTEETKR